MKKTIDSLLDFYDKKILSIMAVDGRISVAELANQIGLSKTPTLKRLRKLEQTGYITGYQAQLDYDLLDETHVAFINVTLSDTTAASLKKFNAAVKELVAVEQCNMIAGNFDYLLKVRTTDIQEYRTLLGEKIAALPFVSHTSTFVSMETVCDRQKVNL
ncbi:Lrp/AsnC ligand binding domain-containing protein [Cocleimonas sp. KMM 6892]|jgi:Lrp/AsnC family leucine-responsive transcriptional regulator|uniref:Lrp/AsnC ligand binding domain-containing protein n=1 Tax=unclassified Cocleimonas TaxID=2639732 RepID=UPI002DBDEAF0|nr:MULTISPECIES: Lrp/AsnC ligand binding domain-containing protein [unclassified Cocleimonas]MEB8432762.1 Lrp/AsnC ligand binding domain-containing protein [Cocleimonas sp. KMM 6892]MEC4715621.1 Lrp/AsnC ligand binding domain-containing protein [Cocleimonas sp. KMM 6895]MEC4744761.1 Lrp/AsnC ligand binding domain-containing protein [Cocleimonas sp. KMM 6896]